jgi:hypothetical protein
MSMLYLPDSDTYINPAIIGQLDIEETETKPATPTSPAEVELTITLTQVAAPWIPIEDGEVEQISTEYSGADAKVLFEWAKQESRGVLGVPVSKGPITTPFISDENSLPLPPPHILQDLLETAKTYLITAEQIEAFQRSFAYINEATDALELERKQAETA